MFQTSPAGAGIAKLGLEPSGGNTGYSADSNDAFSQEFDKQVKNISKKEEAPEASAPVKANSGSDQEDTAEETRTDEQGLQDAASQELAQDEFAGGKDLPPSLADQQILDEPAVEPAQGESAETIAPELTALLGKQGRAVAEGEPLAQVQPLKVTPLGSAVREAIGGDPEMVADEGGASLRLRDVLTQRFANIHSENGPQAGVGRVGKFDLQGLLSGTPLQVGSTTTGSDGSNGVAAALGLSLGVVSSGSAASAPATLALAVPLQQKGWDQALSERVVWLARSNIQEAKLELNPRELGPIEIKIAVKQDQAHVQFVAHHATTREALEAAMPRLRDMLNDSGLNLAQSDVSQHSFRDGERSTQAETGVRTGLADGGLEAGEGSEGLTASHVSQVGPRGIDYFA